MLRFSLTQMRSSLGRLVAAAIAIVLGTGFVTATLLATDIVRATAEATVTADLRGADLSVEGYGLDDQLVADVAAIPGVDTVDAQLVEGLLLDMHGGTRYLSVQSLPTRGQRPPLESGAVPTAMGEVAISKQLADTFDVAVGETIQWSGLDSDARGTVVVSGITGRGSLLLGDAPGWATAETIRMLQQVQGRDTTQYDGLLVYAGDAEPDALRADVERLGTPENDLTVLTAREVIDREVRDLTGNADFFVVFGLAFAAVAVVVAGMVITNTFEVLVAQRTRVLALMRCGGATKGQVRRSVLIEAALLGLVASIGGVLLGLLIGQGAAWFLGSRAFGIEAPALTAIGPSTLLAPIVVGLVITTIAAIGPARAATRVSPVAALRPRSVDPVRGGGMPRLVLGALMGAVGLLMLLAPPIALRMGASDVSSDIVDHTEELLFVGIGGGLLTVAAFLVLSVFIVPAVTRLLGSTLAAVLPKEAAATARLATANAIRNPRRTAATTSALVIGVGLVVMMATGAATARATLTNSLSASFPTDVLVTALGDDGIGPEERDAVAAVDGVLAVAPAWQGHVSALRGPEDWVPYTVVVGEPAELDEVFDGRGFDVEAGHVGLNPRIDEYLGSPAELQLQGPDGASVTLPVTVVEHLPMAILVAPASIGSLALDEHPDTLVVDVDDAIAGDVLADIQRALPGDSDAPTLVQAPMEMREAFNQVIDAILAVLVGLLGVAVVIALVGVANTLSLSVIERRREHGVLRSIGVTAPQLRRMLAVEGVLIAVSGAAIGIVIGIVTGLAGATILLGSAPEYAPGLDVWITLGSIGVALVAGLVASVLPARTATRVPVVVALAAD